MNRSNIEKIAQTSQDRMLLAKLWDKIQAGFQRNIPAHTGFLSPAAPSPCIFPPIPVS